MNEKGKLSASDDENLEIPYSNVFDERATTERKKDISITFCQSVTFKWDKNIFTNALIFENKILFLRAKAFQNPLK